MPRRRFLLTIQLAPGDVLLLTALVRDLKATYGDEYAVSVESKFPAIWRHNPHVEPHDPTRSDVEIVKMTYDVRRPGREIVHFLRDYYRLFESRTGIAVPCLAPKADLHFSAEEVEKSYVEKPYWIIIPGGKTDITNKFWAQDRYQATVDRLRPAGLKFIQEGAVKKYCVHPPLTGVLNLVGSTSVRDLIVNVLHAEGVICGVTFPMHIAASLDKPCVVLGGSREEPWWEDYSNDWAGAFGSQAGAVRVPHRFLHSFGQLPCARQPACWRQRTHKLFDKDKNDRSLCDRPKELASGQTIAECLDLITVDHVVDAVVSYYYDRTLTPPPGTPLSRDVEQIMKQSAREEISFQRWDGAQVTIKTTRNNQPANFVIDNEIPPVSVPVLRRETEHMQTGMARPELGLKHNAPGVKQKPATQLVVTPQQVIAPPPGRSDKFGLLDDPRIGGKFTICVLMYGDKGTKYHELHRRCLNSILKTVPPSRMDLRVGCNEVPPETESYLRSLPIQKTYTESRQIYKYPMMRRMFHDPEQPITTPWIIWLDDDSYIRNDDWLLSLTKTILNQNPKFNVALLGQQRQHPLRKGSRDPRDWFRKSPSYRGKEFQNRYGRAVPNGDRIVFVNGGFWCLSTEAMRRADIPDPRLRHNGGDICIGFQVYQNGYTSLEFNTDKVLCHTSAAPRRGYEEKFPWYTL